MDQAIYQAIAATHNPGLDRVLRPLARSADRSMIWLATAAVIAALGGAPGRRAAVDGVASIALASALVNQGFKRLSRRTRPDPAGALVPVTRHVAMPPSTSFPSGHSASAFAFAAGVGATMPLLGAAIGVAAGTVAFTRVYTGVHYPGDVLAGSLIGVACGKVAPTLLGGLGMGGELPGAP